MWKIGESITHINTGNITTITKLGPYPKVTSIDSKGIVVIDHIHMFRTATTMDMMREICGKN